MSLVTDTEAFDPRAEAILEAARSLFIRYGLRRTSLNDIARAAGVSRATLFRRFPNREALLAELVQAEAHRLIARVDEQVTAASSPEDRLVTGFLAFMKELRGHDLLRPLMTSDPEQILPLLTTDGAPALALGRAFVLSWLHRARADGATLTGEPEHLAELFIRLAHSLALTPQTPLPVNDDQALRDFATRCLVPMTFSAAG